MKGFSSSIATGMATTDEALKDYLYLLHGLYLLLATHNYQPAVHTAHTHLL